MEQFYLEQYETLLSSNLYFEILETIQKDLPSAFITTSSCKESLVERLQSLHYDQAIINLLHSHLSNSVDEKYTTVSTTNYLAIAQSNWEKKVSKSLSTMCSELSFPLARKRSEKDVNALQAKWTEMSVLEKDVSAIRPVYAPKDFLEVLSSIRNPCIKNSEVGADNTLFWGLIQVPLDLDSISTLKLKYTELNWQNQQTGVVVSGIFDKDTETDKFLNAILDRNSAPLAQEFAKKGVPLAFRRRLWSLILSVKVNDAAKLYVEHLKQSVLDNDLLVDSLIFKDVKLSAASDDTYFVYEDYLHMIGLMFSRDSQVLRVFKKSTASPSTTFPQTSSSIIYPPSGVIPFHGFIMFLCPICYLYSSPYELYLVFRELYIKYFYKLHIISDNADSILPLSALFEYLLQTAEPELFLYLKSENIQPLRIAFKWLMRAFSGSLAPEQILLLWDRIIAYESLTILPVLAAAIFVYRKSNLMLVKSFTAAEAVLADLTTLQITPLIQLILFSRH